jgi:hypothetical protein
VETDKETASSLADVAMLVPEEDILFTKLFVVVSFLLSC